MRIILSFLCLIVGLNTFGQFNSSIVVFNIHKDSNKYSEKIYLDVSNDSNVYCPPYKVNDSIFMFRINKTGSYNLIQRVDHSIMSEWEEVPFFNFVIDNKYSDTIRYKLNWKRIRFFNNFNHPHPSFKEYGVPCKGNITEYYSNGSLRIRGKFNDGHPVDSVFLFNPNGFLAFSYSESIKDSLDNILKKYFPNGKIKEEIRRKKDSVVAFFWGNDGIKYMDYFYNIILDEVTSIIYNTETKEPIQKIVVTKDKNSVEYNWINNEWKLIY